VQTPGLPNLALTFSPSVTERIGKASVEHAGEYLSISRPGYAPLELRMTASLEGSESFNIPVGSESHGQALLALFTEPCP
jgi:hypothetical protein